MIVPGGKPSYGADIRGLFREIDRDSMNFAFDLWSYVDVRDNALGILERLMAGSMPCDAEWPPETIAVFRRWVDSDMAE